ncbi:DUF3093 family protein [Frankia sp. Cas3]|uniref:DUF3093 family protein n=1 Tax=Frankia sp. Cas3 TaxID=3073926 RepID=UPI002AD4C358|nr:DUF3093 family protein [Frankia sp. Cas3]
MRYEERLAVPRLWHLWAALCAGVFGSYFTVYTDATWTRAVVYGAMFTTMEAALWQLGRPRLAMTDEAMRAAGEMVDRADIRDAVACTDVRTVLVPGVYALTRPWIRTGVRVTTATGVWVLSSRHPGTLLTAISAPVPR